MAQQQHPAQQAGGRGCANKPLITEQPVDALASGPRLSPLSGKSCALDSMGHKPLPCHSGHPSPRPLSFPLPGPWSPVRKRRLQWQPRHSSQQCSAEQVLRHPSPIILPGLPALVGQSGDNFTAHSSPRNHVRWGQHTCPHNNTAVLKLSFSSRNTHFLPHPCQRYAVDSPPPDLGEHWTSRERSPKQTTMPHGHPSLLPGSPCTPTEHTAATLLLCSQRPPVGTATDSRAHLPATTLTVSTTRRAQYLSPISTCTIVHSGK